MPGPKVGTIGQLTDDATPAPVHDLLRVVIASDVRLYLEGLAGMLVREPGLEVVGIAGAHLETLERVAACEPDVLLIDMAMAGSMDIVRRVREAGRTICVALALPETERTFLPCAEAGVLAYVPREASVADLVRALHCAWRGEALISPKLAGSLVRRVFSLSEHAESAQAGIDLTRREAEIAELIAAGKTNKRIAAELQIGLPTVKNHVHNILRKMNLTRRAEVALHLSRRRSSELPELRRRERPGAGARARPGAGARERSQSGSPPG